VSVPYMIGSDLIGIVSLRWYPYL